TAGREHLAHQAAGQRLRAGIDVEQHLVAFAEVHTVADEQLGVALQEASVHGRTSADSARPVAGAASLRSSSLALPTAKALVPRATSVPPSSLTSVHTTITRRPARTTLALANSCSPRAGVR